MKGDFLIYKNPKFRKVRGSHILLISCGYCKTDIAKYQKVGKGNLLRMKINRIIESSVDLSKDEGRLVCPNCGGHLGTRMILKGSNNQAFRMIRSAFNTREGN